MIDVQKLAREAGFANQYWPPSIAEPFERFASLVLEEAAKVCDDIWQEDGTPMQCRDAIRALKQGEA